MAKKRKQDIVEEQRQTRKEILLARKQEKQTRQIRLAVIGVIALLAVVFAIGIVNELLIKPTLPVAIVNDEEISLGDWQDRVRLQRAQLIIGLEDLEETVGGDIGLVQQFAGQQINLLLQPDVLGQLVLEDMIDDRMMRQNAEIRGITVTEEEVDERIAENFNYYGGDSPTPFPTATQTVMPTPSITPIPTEVITDVLPTNTPLPTATMGPTSTPLPTATPVSQETFEEELSATLDDFRSYGVSEETYRDFIRGQIYRDKFLEALAEERGYLTEDEMVSMYILTFDTEEEAEEAAAVIAEEDFLTVWNTIRSKPVDPESSDTARASEVLWRQQETLSNQFGDSVGEAAFELEIGEPSDILIDEASTEEDTDTYYIIQVSGREVRPLSESNIQQNKENILTTWLESAVQDGVEQFDLWQQNVPQQPVLSPRFLAQPTEAPPQPTVAIPAVPEESGEEQ